MFHEFIEIVDGNDLNKKIENDHLGKTFRDVLSEKLINSDKIEKSLDLILNIDNENKIKPMYTPNKSDQKSIHILRLSNIIMKLALNYTQEIYLRKKNKQISKELKELKKAIEEVRNILLDLQCVVIKYED